MADISDEVKQLLGRPAAARLLAAEFGIGSPEAVSRGIANAVPAVVAGLRRRLENTTGLLGLLETVRNLDTQCLHSAALFSPNSDRSLRGPEISRQIFGSELARTVTGVANAASVTPAEAESLLGSVSWTVSATLADRYGRSLDRRTLHEVLASSERNVAGSNLGSQRMERPEPTVRVPLVAPVAAPVPLPVGTGVPSNPRTMRLDGVPQPAMAADGGGGRYPPPVRGPGRAAPSSPVSEPTPREVGRGPGTPSRGFGNGPSTFPSSPSPSTAAGYQPPGQRQAYSGGSGRQGGAPSFDGRDNGRMPGGQNKYGTRFDPQRNGQYDTDTPLREPHPAGRASGSRGNKPYIWAALGLAALLFTLGGLFVLRDRIFTGGTETEAAEGVDSTDSTAVATTLLAAEVVPGDMGPAPTDPLDLTVEMVDIFTGTTKQGIGSLTLHPVNGEICYHVTTEGVDGPYDAHIHRGDAGIKGGIVVDFGEFNNPDTGCYVGRPVDIQAIMRNLDKFYLEMHDINGTEAIRGQLSSGLTDEQLADRVEELDDEHAMHYDPDGGGAVTSIENGRVVLSGEVPDEETAKRLLAEYEGTSIAGAAVVDELTVNPEAPLPSGRIVVDSSIFFDVNSEQLGDARGPVLSELAALFQARPSWSMIVTGHTDSTGSDVYNLELSLRRAEAVRDALMALGVADTSMRVTGAGSTAPIDTNDTVAGRANNRRIEFEIDTGAG